MGFLAQLLGCWRARAARAWIPPGASVLALGGAPPEMNALAPASFDVIVLADSGQTPAETEALIPECQRLLRPGGRVIVTLAASSTTNLDPLTTPRLFARAGFIVESWRLLQFGRHYLFVLWKPVETRLVRAETPAPAEDAVHVAA